MNTDIIDDPRIILNLDFMRKKMINITTYAKNDCSISMPKNLTIRTITLGTDNKGYISPNNEQIDPSLMGTLIDYLVRFTICHDFTMADSLDSYDIENLFDDADINHLTNEQLNSAFEFAKDEQFMRSHDYSVYDQKFVLSNTFKKHIEIMLNRCKNFFDQYGYPSITGFHAFISKSKTPMESLQSLYQKPIDELHSLIKGDGDYLLPSALIDLKVSKSKTQSIFWKRQLIIYYLGLDKNELKENNISYKQIKYLIDFNPRYDMIHRIDIYPKNIKDWTTISAAINTDLDNIDEKLQAYTRKLKNDLKARALVTEDQASRFTDKFIKYKDGIHRLTKSEYPVKWNGQVYLVKRNGIYMFFLKYKTRKTKTRPSGNALNILNGGQRKRAAHDLQYYYDNLPLFVSTIKSAFSKYQAALDKLTYEIGLIEETNLKYIPYANHGSIIDVGDRGHIYLDPLSGLLKYYIAPSSTERISYASLNDLLADAVDTDFYGQRNFDNYQKLSNKSYLKQYNNSMLRLNMPKQAPIILDNMNKLIQITPKITYERGYDKIMYSRSRAMTQIQKIFKDHTVTFWSEAVINHNSKIDFYNTNNLPFDNSLQLSSPTTEAKSKQISEYQLITKTISKPFKQLTKIPQKSILILSKHIDQKYVKKINQIQHKRTKLRQLHYSKVIAISKSIRIKNHHWLQDIDLNLIKSILLDTINITNQMEWNKTLERYRHSLKGSEISVLNEFHKKLIPLIKQIGKPDQINLFIKDKNKKVIGYADLQINNQLILLELIKDTKINTYMLNNLNKLKAQSNKSIVLYKMALGKLFIFEH